MAAYITQLQPYEENQSPSPIEELSNPLEQLSLARSRSSGRNQQAQVSPVNTLHRQLSGDPDAPPPAWKRRSTFTNRSPSSRGGLSPVSPHSQSINRRATSGSDAYGAPSRRHLAMTSSTRTPLPNQLFLHESPNSSATNLADLGYPQPAFRRRSQHSGSSSNRSSLHSLTSEDLWRLGSSQNIPDFANPDRRSDETPLETAKRMSRMMDLARSNPLPGEMIWPTASPDDDFGPQMRSKSTTSIPGKGNKKLTISRKRSTQSNLSPNAQSPIHLSPSTVYPKSVSGSPIDRTESLIISSTNSSSTSLNSQSLKPSPIVRPASGYYSRDFLSSLAPREGGYAIAASMGNGLGAMGVMSVEERRRSTLDNRRAPVSKSAGMGRWSLDGGEPYGTPSANTTNSNLTGSAVNSNESPPLEILLPEGAASPGMNQRRSQDGSSANSTPINAFPPNPSPLSQQTHANDLSSQTNLSAIPVPPIPDDAAPTGQTLNVKKSKKELAKEAKAAQKAEAAKIAQQKAEAARQEQVKRDAAKYEAAQAKVAKKHAAIRAKEDAKQKEKDEKIKRKQEKISGKTSSPISPITPAVTKKQEVPSVSSIPSIPSTASAATTTATATTTTTVATAVTQPTASTAVSTSSSQQKTSPAVGQTPNLPRPPTATAPIAAVPTKPAAPTQSSRPPAKTRMSLFGTIKRKLTGGDVSRSRQTSAPASVVPPVPVAPVPNARSVSTTAVSSAPTTTPVAPVPIHATPQPQSTIHSAALMAPLPDGAATPVPGNRSPTRPPLAAYPSPTIAPVAPSASDQPPPPPPKASSPRPHSTRSPTSGRSASFSSPTQHATPLAKSFSHDSPSPSPGRSNSIRGPRAMPSRASPDLSKSSRPQSIVTVTTPSTEAAPTTPASFPFAHSHHVNVVTPSTSADSSVFSTLPQSSANHGGYHGDLPVLGGVAEREGSGDSKSSNQTIQRGRGSIVA